jgi:hypothetical protein
MYTRWVNKGLTIRDFGTVLEEISTLALAQPEKVIGLFQAYIAKPTYDSNEKGSDFTNMDDKKKVAV